MDGSQPTTALELQLEFVRERVPEVSDLAVETYDCDSGGPAFAGFEASASPVAVRDGFLADPSCRMDVVEDEPGIEHVSCGSGRKRVDVWLEPSRRAI